MSPVAWPVPGTRGAQGVTACVLLRDGTGRAELMEGQGTVLLVFFRRWSLGGQASDSGRPHRSRWGWPLPSPGVSQPHHVVCFVLVNRFL